MNKLLFIILFCLINLQVAIGSQSIEIVRNHKTSCVIVIPAEAGCQDRLTAELLASHIAKSTDIELNIYTESQHIKQELSKRIYVGMTSRAKEFSSQLSKLDSDGFMIIPVDSNTLIIAGPTDWGTEFGVCDFLERFVGVRWLMPGDSGTFIPRRSQIDGPETAIKDEPASFSRVFSGLSNVAQTTWARRNRNHDRISFHHNLINLFPPETYAKTHPDFFPIHDGKRFLPQTNLTHGWQPCFSAPGITEEAVKNIKLYFSEHPNATSYSLGVNDSTGDCECAACQSKDSGEKTFNGYRSTSDRYFAWCNTVVTEVLKEYPDKWFGVLAYGSVIEPPLKTKVHERIVPFICCDRLKWTLNEDCEQGHKVVEAWQKVCPTLGWYDYMYGSPYLVPRVYFHLMAQNYKYAYEHNVKLHYAEVYPNWGEGPKLYVAMKLQWNPNLDVNDLLDDWYVSCVGKNAAADLAGYYKLWEDFWTGPALKSSWKSISSKSEYLFMYSPDYLDVATTDMAQKSRKLLESTVSKAETDDQRARAQLLLRAFEYYEASLYAYFGSQKYLGPVNTEQDAIKFISAVLQTTPFVEKRRSLLTSFDNDPVLVQPLGEWSSWQSVPLKSECWGTGSLWPIYSWMEKSEAVRNEIIKISKNGQGVSMFQAENMVNKFNKSQKKDKKQ